MSKKDQKKKNWSFIDFALKDFLRTDYGDVVIREFASFEEAEEWLLEEGEEYGWQNKGMRYWCWDDQE